MEGASSSSSVPVGQRAKSKATATSSTAKQVEKEETEESYLMQEGKIGRLLVYKSGKVKMQVGDIVMDVSSGSECSFLQDVVVVDSNSKQSFVMGSVQKRMVCVPNLTQLLSGLEAVDV
ncbi:RNA polymerase III RPC4-domain-containing protein [Dissophora ornata]|nr:RNA polymerase III RPC4-domain-containing protein [Dissophora ornata]